MRLPIILLALAVASTAYAQSDFAPLIASALDNNRELQSQASSAQATYLDEKAEIAPEGPSLDFEYLWNHSGGPNRWSAGISQEVEFPGSYSARSHAASAAYNASQALLAAARADKALSVKEAIIDIINATILRDYYQELGQRIGHIADAVNRSFELGEATILDKRKMQLASLDNEQTIAAYDAQIAYLTSVLEGMGASMPADSSLLWNCYPIQKCEQPSAHNDRLLYALRDARLEAARAKSRALKLSALPSLEIGYLHAYEDGVHFNGITAGLKLPSFGTAKRLKAAAAEAESIALESEGEIISVVAENQGLYAKAEHLREVMAKYRNLSNDNSYLALLTKAYDAGQLTVIDYLNEVNIFSGARLAYLELLYQYNLTLARLNRYRSADF